MLRFMPVPARTNLRALHRALGIPADYPARRLPFQRVARRLVIAARAADDGQPVRLTPSAAAAWRKMRAAAARDGIELLPISGFRSVARQTRIIRRKLAEGQAIGAILKLVAAPGCSEHHTGRALDLGSPGHTGLDADFAITPAFRWLTRHGAKYGFHLSYSRKNPLGIAFEPWHWCWRR